MLSSAQTTLEEVEADEEFEDDEEVETDEEFEDDDEDELEEEDEEGEFEEDEIAPFIAASDPSTNYF